MTAPAKQTRAPKAKARKKPRKIKIATFNANSIRARLDIVLGWLKQHKPDVLCLQETKAQDKDFPELAIRGAGYHAAFRGEKSYNGVAILTKEKPKKISFGLGGKEPDETRLAYVNYRGLHIVNTYVPQGRGIDLPQYRYKLSWFRRLGAYFDAHFTPRQRVLWCGDLNVAPEAIDVHSPETKRQHVCYHEDVRNAFRRTFDWGFVDVFRKFHPDEAQYSFFDYRFKDSIRLNVGWRIDHILATKPLEKKAHACEIDIKPRLMQKPSDHTFVVAEFMV